MRHEYFSDHSLQWLETAWHDGCISLIASSIHKYTTPHAMLSIPSPFHFLLFCISLHYFFTPCALRKSLACELRDIHHVERHPETQRESNICCCVRLLFSVWACGVLSNDCTVIIVWQSDIYPQTALPVPAKEIGNIQNHTDRCFGSFFTVDRCFAVTNMYLNV